ncbi:MAG: hypothetical protein SFZ23_12485 [Planctomycetota bacterium]|nr:hypothetical protein [Planctomycetota bacterium]
MNVTARLVKLFQVEKQLRGLKSRLGAAEQFLTDQLRQLEEIDARRSTLEAQLKQASASAANAEGETKRIDARMETIRKQMNDAKTNKEYKAFLSEVNTLKEERDKHETTALEQMAKVDGLRKQLDDLASQRAERERVRGVADADRSKRAEEIRERLAELSEERKRLAADVPETALKALERLVTTKGEDAMAPIEEQDRKRMEYTCGACMMSLPIESLNGLLTHGNLTRCVSCSSILYIEDTLQRQLTESKK